MNTIKINMIAMLLVLIGAINWGLVAFKYNLVELLAKYTHPSISFIIYVLVAISAVYLLVQRDIFLPFLGESVFPCSLLEESVPDNATVNITVQVKPNVKVVYWASEPDLTDVNYKQAYGEYTNSGVVVSDNNGRAVLKVRKPSSYSVPTGRVINTHVHYRCCLDKNMLSPVKTVYV